MKEYKVNTLPVLRLCHRREGDRCSWYAGQSILKLANIEIPYSSRNMLNSIGRRSLPLRGIGKLEPFQGH
jgi:hypothetical protein